MKKGVALFHHDDSSLMSARKMTKMRMLIGGLIMSLVECHLKTWQATLNQGAAQEVTNLHQHQCAWASIGAGTSAALVLVLELVLVLVLVLVLR